MDELISRQEAVDIVLEYVKKLCEPIGTPEDNEMYSYGRGLLISILLNLNHLPSAQQWVPVSEGSPKENGKYLVSVKKSEWGGSTIHSVRTMTYNKKEVAPFEWGHYEIYSGKVIAWMPLPEPYEEVNE